MIQSRSMKQQMHQVSAMMPYNVFLKTRYKPFKLQSTRLDNYVLDLYRACDYLLLLLRDEKNSHIKNICVYQKSMCYGFLEVSKPFMLIKFQFD